MKPVLILQHQVPENAAYLKTWLEDHGIDYVVFNAGAGEEFPKSIEPYAAMAVMGGGMSANDDLPSNHQAIELIRQAFARDVPVIGHCLGGQLMSRALGATVHVADVPEIGWQPIQYADHDLARAWFGDTPTDTVIQWHYDTFNIPLGATLLASSPTCANQAWGQGPHLAMQFHIEINETKIDSWVSEDDDKWAQARTLFESAQSRQTILDRTARHIQQHQRTADHIYGHWLSSTEWKNNLHPISDDTEMYRIDVETPWFKLMADKIDWKEIIVVAMVLLTVVYLVKG